MKLVARRRRLLIGLAVLAIVLSVTGGSAALYAGSVPTPPLPRLGGSTEIRYADGSILALVGDDDQLPIDTRTLPPYVAGAVLAAEDPNFYDRGWFGRPSRLTVQLTRQVTGMPPGRSARLAVAAAKVEKTYGKDIILDRYLNTVYFGRRARGVEAAADAFFGKPAAGLTLGEAVVLAAQISSPGDGAFDPTLNPDAAKRRFDEIRKAIPGGDTAVFPTGTLILQVVERAWAARHPRGPAGVIARRVLDELRVLHLQDVDDVASAGLRITTAIDPRLQRALEAQADAAVEGSVMQGQPESMQAAAVAVQPGTGRILAYFGGHDGTGFDFAGGYRGAPDAEVALPHPAGNVFAPILLAAALKSGISLQSQWLAPPAMEFPAFGRHKQNPVRDNKRCPGGRSSCSLLDAQRDGLRVPLYAVTAKVTPDAVIDMARACGIEALWATVDNRAMRIALDRPGKELYPKYFNAEVGLGQYPIAVVDEAGAMATFAAGGKRAATHLITEVSSVDRVFFHDAVKLTDVLDEAQSANLTWALSQQPAGRLADGRATAAAVGEWQFANDASSAAHAWAAGYTPQVAVAVWIGNKDQERPLNDRTGAAVTGSTLPAQIYRQFLGTALVGTPKTDVARPAFIGDPKAGNA